MLNKIFYTILITMIVSFFLSVHFAVTGDKFYDGLFTLISLTCFISMPVAFIINDIRTYLVSKKVTTV